MTHHTLKPTALIQHPMWLIIKEDSLCYERKPPWGSPNIEDYAGRLSRNLRSMETNPALRVNYDFSAVELADVNAMFPELGERIRQAIGRGQLCIVNGTYSQAHLHTLSLEASVRQFQEGKRLIRDLFGYDVRTYIMQEPGYTAQTPQVMKAFGYRYFQQGCFITRCQADFLEDWTHKEPFLAWRGLDGTEIPAIGEGLGLFSSMPDMTEIAVDPKTTYLFLDEFLAERDKEDKSRRKAARFWIPWSYLEGTDGEELSQINCACETALAQLDAISALLGKSSESRELWHRWLLCQHHDAYWHGAPELRSKSKTWLNETIARAHESSANLLADTFHPSRGGRKGLVLASIYPRPHRGVLAIDWSDAIPANLITNEGKAMPAQPIHTPKGQTRLLLSYRFDGAGIVCMAASSGESSVPNLETMTGPIEFSNQFYRAVFNSDGSINSIAPAGGQSLMQPGTADAILSVGDRLFTPTHGITVQHGPVATIIDSAGILSGMPVTRRTICYNDLPWFEFFIECAFTDNARGLGDFYDDTTKLTLRWLYESRNASTELTTPPRLVQGIGGGAGIPDEPRRAFFPVNWLDIGCCQGGLALINFGTFKHVQDDQDILTVLAWGGKTARFGNRVDHNLEDWAGSMDLQIRGTRSFRFAVYPHSGDWRQAGVCDVAMSVLRPPAAYPCTFPSGQLPLGKGPISVQGSLIPTALFSRGGALICRAYECHGSEAPISVRQGSQEVALEICDVAGNPARPRPWGIYNLILKDIACISSTQKPVGPLMRRTIPD